MKTLERLIHTLRANGVTSYVGPLQPEVADSPHVKLELGAAPVAAAPPERETSAPENTERGPDGLTKQEAAEWYGASGG